MTARSPSAFALSTLLHASVAAIVLLGIFYSQQHAPVQPLIFELVAGEGNNYAATEAPALGSSDAPVKFTLPKVEPAHLPSTSTMSEVAPSRPVPVQLPDFTKTLKRAEDRQAKKAAAQAKIEQEKENARLSKADFDRLHGKSSTPKTASVSARPAKVKPIDAEGIAKGVLGGSTANKTGGASGKALTREQHSLLDSYIAFLRQQLRTAFEEVKPPGLSDRLVAIVEVRILSDGMLTNAHIIQSSGSDEFDRAAIEAVGRVRPIGARPDGLDEVLKIPFRMLDDDNGG